MYLDRLSKIFSLYWKNNMLSKIIVVILMCVSNIPENLTLIKG